MVIISYYFINPCSLIFEHWCLNSKPDLVESAEHLKNRKGHALRSDASYSHNIRYPVAQQSPTLLSLSSNIAFPSDQQLFHPDSYSNGNLDKYMSSSKTSKFTEKYSSKLKNRDAVACISSTATYSQQKTWNSWYCCWQQYVRSWIVESYFFQHPFVFRKIGIPFPGIPCTSRKISTKYLALIIFLRPNNPEIKHR